MVFIMASKLDIKRLKKIKKLINIPIVLHCGYNLPVEQSMLSIDGGIKKFNIGTDLKNKFAKTLKEVLNQKPMPYKQGMRVDLGLVYNKKCHRLSQFFY